MTSTTGDKILGPQLRAAREELNLTPGEAAKALGITQEELMSWESGEATPDDDQLWSLSELYGRSVAAFFSPLALGPQRQDFRAPAHRKKLDTNVARVTNALFSELCRARDVLEKRHHLQRSNDVERLRRAGRGLEVPEMLATAIRGEAGLADSPIPKIRDIMESWGIMVFFVNLPSNDLAGTSWWHDTWGPATLVNRSDTAGRRNFTLAHELAHLLRLHIQPLCDLNEQTGEERFANRFATVFLMPESDVRKHGLESEESGDLNGWETEKKAIAKLANRYGTSIQATSYRLEELGFLPKGFTEARAADLKDYFPRTKGQRWRKALRDLGESYIEEVRKAYFGGEMSLAAAADLLNLEADQALEWLEENSPRAKTR